MDLPYLRSLCLCLTDFHLQVFFIGLGGGGGGGGGLSLTCFDTYIRPLTCCVPPPSPQKFAE